MMARKDPRYSGGDGAWGGSRRGTAREKGTKVTVLRGRIGRIVPWNASCGGLSLLLADMHREGVGSLRNAPGYQILALQICDRALYGSIAELPGCVDLGRVFAQKGTIWRPQRTTEDAARCMRESGEAGDGGREGRGRGGGEGREDIPTDLSSCVPWLFAFLGSRRSSPAEEGRAAGGSSLSGSRQRPRRDGQAKRGRGPAPFETRSAVLTKRPGTRGGDVQSLLMTVIRIDKRACLRLLERCFSEGQEAAADDGPRLVCPSMAPPFVFLRRLEWNTRRQQRNPKTIERS
ncbi:hypothetical protein HPB47_010100 [Ixodes persulcatus]|uniref:Uncharacterized protein n=1 Tax=Ixodes persulcatus TaxID=34615 RepID=A0AC60P051_IXOPE|nr:hypothetical protein HPB47_010100 [Ixodes persulcatus]